MDDWALATAADPEDRTRIKGIVSIDPAGPRRRSRKAPTSPASRSSTRESLGSLGGSGTRAPEAHARRIRSLVWSLVACSALLVAFGVTAGIVLVRASSVNDIPTVHDVSGRVSSGTIVFSWQDPGLLPQDSYQVRVGDAPPSVQRGTEFRVDVGSSNGSVPVCITVAVNRDGRTGPASAEKCVTPTGGS